MASKFSLFRGKGKTSERPGVLIWLLAQLIIILHSFLRVSSRENTKGLEHIQKLEADGKPFILAFWHGNLLTLSVVIKHKMTRPSYVLTSKSPYGSLMDPFIRYLGFGVLRGSGTGKAAKKPKKKEKGGREAFHVMLKLLAKKENIIITSDIAPGPSYDSGEGLIVLASRAGVPIIPAAAASRRHKIFPKSWDKSQFPFPFNRFEAVFGAPIYIDKNLSEEDLEKNRVAVTEQLNRCFDEAHAAVDKPSPRNSSSHHKV